MQEFGNGSGTAKVRQSFVPGYPGWKADALWLKVARNNHPLDNLRIEITDDSETVLASGDVVGADLHSDLAWTRFPLTLPVDLADATYWITLSRTGLLHSSNYYKAKLNESMGYGVGSFRIWNGSAWVARAPDANLLFKLLGAAETSDQLVEIASQAAGQFLAGEVIEDASGLRSSLFRDGSRTGLQEARLLLAAGCSDGGQLLAEVDRQRILHLRKRPSTVEVWLDEDGRYVDQYRQPVKPADLVNKLLQIEKPELEITDRVFITRVEVDQGGIVLNR